MVLRTGFEATREELQDHARNTIAGYKVPKSIDFRTEPIPLSGALKPLKRELRRPYWEHVDDAADTAAVPDTAAPHQGQKRALSSVAAADDREGCMS